ncbi:hypothetical protein BJX63DRAFT_438764 [Aspergillus granulosus]|uniref:Uncharacterized protein n=1 Tax=Aspergillus granulosus TaxID=176169 RepID=A0ABR4GR94_9EURO
MATNLVLLDRLNKEGLWWDNHLERNIIHTRSGATVAYLEKHHRMHSVRVGYNPQGQKSIRAGLRVL